MSQTYQEPDGLHLLTLFHLSKQTTFSTTTRANKQAIRTIHDDLHILHKTIQDRKGPHSSLFSLILRQPVQSLQHSFNIVLSKKLLSEFLCIALVIRNDIRKDGAYSVVLV
jgi:hypothetical protein